MTTNTAYELTPLEIAENIKNFLQCVAGDKRSRFRRQTEADRARLLAFAIEDISKLCELLDDERFEAKAPYDSIA